MESKHMPAQQGPSEDARNLALMNRALTRSDAELGVYRAHYEARRLYLSQRLLSTEVSRVSYQHPALTRATQP